MLIPMYLLIGIWGYDRRIYAAVKFILYTMAGSVVMLLAILALAVLNESTTGTTASICRRSTTSPFRRGCSSGCSRLCAGVRHQGATVSVPHLVADARVEAPTAGWVILAGGWGTYGLVRFAFPFFRLPRSFFAPYLAFLAVVGSFTAPGAMVQPTEETGGLLEREPPRVRGAGYRGDEHPGCSGRGV